MKIEINEYESPHTLRAVATLLITLAEAPNRYSVEKGCPEPCDKAEPLPGRLCAYEPFDIFPNEVAAPSTRRIVPPPGYEVVAQVHDETILAPIVPTPPATARVVAAAPLPPHAYTGPQSDFTPKPDLAPPRPVTFEGFGAHLPQVPSATAPSIVAVDKTGAPWDARIHSSSKALVADGTWRLKRGVDKSLLKKDEEVLRVLDAVLVPPSPPLGAVPLPPAPPLPFNEIMRFFAVHSMAGKLTHADMEAMAKHSGVELTQELINAANAEKRPAALAYLQNLVDSRS